MGVPEGFTVARDSKSDTRIKYEYYTDRGRSTGSQGKHRDALWQARTPREIAPGRAPHSSI